MWCAAHTPCSGRGVCDLSVGMCECLAGFVGASCEESEGDESGSSLAVLYVRAQLESYGATMLHLVSERPSSSEFYQLFVESDWANLFSIRGDGYSTLHTV